MQEILDCFVSYLRELDSRAIALEDKISRFEKFSSIPEIKLRIENMKGQRDAIHATKELFKDYFFLAKEYCAHPPECSGVQRPLPAHERQEAGSLEQPPQETHGNRKLPNIQNILGGMPGLLQKHTDT